MLIFVLNHRADFSLADRICKRLFWQNCDLTAIAAPDFCGSQDAIA
ncbi:MAG TPA: hypothetical protein V6C57_02735 [Coleofasciculaceae cyanobacterium]